MILGWFLHSATNKKRGEKAENNIRSAYSREPNNLQVVGQLAWNVGD